MDQGPDLDNWKLLTAAPVLGMYVVPTVHTVGGVFKGTGLREQCVVEIIGTVYMTEPSSGFYVNFWDSGRQVQRCTHFVATQDKPHM